MTLRDLPLLLLAGVVLLAPLATARAAPGEPDGPDATDLRAERDAMLGMLDESLSLYRAGETEDAAMRASDAFLEFEGSDLHGRVLVNDRALYDELESTWVGLWNRMRAEAPEDEVEAQVAEVRGLLDRTIPEEEAEATRVGLFVQSFGIILREGFEALLILAMMAAYLRKIGQGRQIRWLWSGAAVAIGGSIGLAYLLRSLLNPRTLGASQEAIEGFTMLLAAGVLFWVSYWLISKVEGRKWQNFIRSRTEEAISTGRMSILAGLAFVVFFREGVETVLFYQALSMQTAGVTGGVSMLLWGGVAGTVALVFTYGGMTWLGLKIPLRPFFAATSGLLLFMAFRFAGTGILELQEAALIATTPAPVPTEGWLVTILGLQSSWEALAAQGVVLGLVLAGLAWTFLLRSGEEGAAPPAADEVEAPEPAEAPTTPELSGVETPAPEAGG